MSVHVMRRVWKESKQSGSYLLLLLAIADFANDDGEAYPAVSTLAKHCRMTTRNANHLLAVLKVSGELEVRLNEGPRGTNVYRVRVGQQHREPLKPPSAQDRPGPLSTASPLNPEAPFSPVSGFTSKPPSFTSESAFPKPLTPPSDEPPLNRQEPPLRSFEAFWSMYPRKAGKKPAAAAFARMKPSAQQLEQMLTALRWQCATETWTKDGGKYIPHPTTWLNQERWRDEPPIGAKPASSLRDSWATQAGFANRYEAENAGCYERNAASFHDGRRIKETA